MLDGSAQFVVLPTLESLAQHWLKVRKYRPFAAQGVDYGAPQFLNPYEWIFAPTIVALVRAVTRWEQIGIRVAWYPWADREPSSHRQWFIDRDEYRSTRIQQGTWAAYDEAEYCIEAKLRTPSTYRGWWELGQLPYGMTHRDWFSCVDTLDIWDPHLPIDEVTRLLQEQTFIDWKSQGGGEVEFFVGSEVDEEIAYWQDVRRNGEDYYGSEN